MTEREWLDLIDKVNAEGPFEPTWESLAKFEYPPFFLNSNLGVFIHWGAFCVAEADSGHKKRGCQRIGSATSLKIVYPIYFTSFQSSVRKGTAGIPKIFFRLPGAKLRNE